MKTLPRQWICQITGASLIVIYDIPDFMRSVNSTSSYISPHSSCFSGFYY